MIINRVELRAAIDTAIAAHKAEYDKRKAAYDARMDEWRREWVKTHSEAWDQAALRIRRLVKKGEPITADDLPGRSGWGSNRPELYSKDGAPRGPGHPGTYHEPRELLALASALDLIIDETVTTAGLERIGIGRSALVMAFRALADAKAAKE